MRALFLQEIKTFFRSPSSIFIFVIPLILLVGLGYFIPAAYIIPSTISVGIVGAVLLYFGGGLEEIKRTSFLKVMGTTKLNKVTTLVVKMSFAALISMATVIWVLGLGFLFSNVIPFLAVNFGHLDETLESIPGKVHWDQVQWAILFYASALSLCVTLALAFCFAAIAKSSLSFYLLTFGYIAALILFGGVIMPGFLLVGNNWFHWFYYLIPNYYSGNQLTAAFNSGLSKTVFTILDKVNVLLTETFPEQGAIIIGYILDPEGAKAWLNGDGAPWLELWNDMATAINAAGKKLDFSNVDQGEQLKSPGLFWYLNILTIYNEDPQIIKDWIANDLISTIKSYYANHGGDFFIDDLFYLLLTVPSTVQGVINTIISGMLPFKFNLTNIIEGVITYGTLVMNLIDTGTVNTIKALVGSMEYSKAFDFTNAKSIIDVFMPYVWIVFLGAISAWKFEWVN